MSLTLKGRKVELLDHMQVIIDLGDNSYDDAAKMAAERIGETVSKGTIHRIARHYNKLKQKEKKVGK